MAITIKQIDLSITNPRLAGLANRSYKDKFTNVPNTKLPTELQQGLSVVYKALTGQDFDLSSNTLAISAIEGQFQRMYVPKLYASEDVGSVCYIRWGNTKIALSGAEGKLVPEVQVPGYKTVIKFALFNPSGRGDDPAIEIKVTPPKGDNKDQDVYVVYFAVAPKDWKTYTAASFETVLETDPTALYELLSCESTKSEQNVSGQVYDDRTFRNALFGADQPQTYELEFQITNVKQVKTSYGVSYILQAQPTNNAELIALFPETAQPFGMWSPKFVKQQLGAVPMPVISEDSPATLVMPIGRPVYLKFSSQTAQDGALDLNFD